MMSETSENTIFVQLYLTVVFLKIEIVSVSNWLHTVSVITWNFFCFFVHLQFVYRLCSCLLFKKKKKKKEKKKGSVLLLSYSVRLYKSLVMCIFFFSPEAHVYKHCFFCVSLPYFILYNM